MYALAIVDDDEQQLLDITEMISKSAYARSFSVSTYDSLEAFERSLFDNPPDAVFMDIAFETHDGFDEEDAGISAVKFLLEDGMNPEIVYITGYDDYYEKVYETPHIALLRKPVTQDRLEVVLGRIFRVLMERKRPPLIVRNAGTVTSVPVSKIRYVESHGRKTIIYYGPRTLESYLSIGKLEKELAPDFIRCHKGFLVNLAYIEEVGKSEIRLTSGEVVFLSQRNRNAVRDAFIEYLENKALR